MSVFKWPRHGRHDLTFFLVLLVAQAVPRLIYHTNTSGDCLSAVMARGNNTSSDLRFVTCMTKVGEIS